MLKAIIQFQSLTLSNIVSEQLRVFEHSSYSQNNFPVYKSNVLTTMPLPELFSKSQTYVNRHEEHVLKNYINALIPLLFESWLEVRPNDESASILNAETADVLKSILEIVMLIYNLVIVYGEEYHGTDIKDTFRKAFFKKFSDHFLTYFPYTQTDQFVRGKDASEFNTEDLACVRQNLLLVYLHLVLNAEVKDRKVINELDLKVFLYLKKRILTWSRTSNYNNELMAMILKEIFSTNCIRLKKTQILILLKIVIECYQNRTFSEEFGSGMILSTLCDVMKNEYLKGSKTYQEWLQMLPKLLCNKRVNINVLDATAKLCRQSNEIVLQGIRENLDEIFETLQHFEGTNVNQRSGRTEMFDSILYYAHSH